MMRHVYEQIRSLKFAYEENINQLMRKVDTIDMKMSRHSCDYSGIESVVRKIDSLDIKVNRLEASNVHRLEELSKTIHTKGIRQELAMDGLVQKVDENHERIKQKLIFAEKRLDTINSKMQVYETSITRVESRLTDIDNDISDMSNTLDDIKSLSTIIDDKHNNTQRSMKEQLQAIKSESAGSRQQLEELSSSVKDIGSRLNDTAQTAMVRDDENVRILSADTDRDLRQQINFESRRIEDKITSMYNNLWSRFMSLETTAKHLLKIGNITRRQLREDFQSLLQSEARFAEPESQENYMNLILDVLKRMLQEHKEQMDSNLQMSLTSQNLFIDSLNKSVHYSNRNEELKDMEITLSSILEKIIYTITNKTSRMDTRLVEVMQMIKEYKTQTMRSLSHLTKIVISLTEKNKEDKERFERGMLDLTKMNEIIASVLQDLYEKFEIVGNMTPSCEESTKCTELNYTKENDNRELDDPDNSREELERETVQENKIKIENDDVVRIYSENGSNIEHTNASYQVLNTTNTTQNNKTTTKKHISIVIPYEAIENEEELKSKLQDFFSRLPVAKTEAVILTNSNKQIPDSLKENLDGNLENIAGIQPNLEQTINNAMNDGISQIIQKLSTNYNNFESKNAENNDGSQENSSDSNLPIESTSDQGVNEEKQQQYESEKKFYDLDGNEDMVRGSQEETKIPPGENGEGSLQNEDKKRFYDWDGNEDMVHSSQDDTKMIPKENEGKSEQNEEENVGKSEQNEEDKKRFYDWDGNEDMIPSSKEDSKILPKENGEKSSQNDDKKTFYDWDGNEDMVRSKEETNQGEKFMESLDNGNAMEIAGNQGTQEGKIQTSTRKNGNLIKFPFVLENSNTTGTNNTSQILSQSSSTGSTTNIDNKIGNNDSISILQAKKNKQSEFTEQMKNDSETSSTGKISKISEPRQNNSGISSTENISKISTVTPKTVVPQLSTVLPTQTTKNSSSTISTDSPASTIKALLLKISSNQPTIETTTKQSQNNEKPKRRTKQDIRQLFEDLKAKRLHRIQELQNLTQENSMMQKDFEDDLKKDGRPLFGEDDTPLARRDTSEHFRPITSSEEITNSAPEFDLLYDEQEMPYSA